MSQHNGTSERELAEKIIHMHDDLGKGFRTVAKELANQGWKVNKDSANRLYNAYKANTSADVIDNKDLMRLKVTEAKQRQCFEAQKEKEEIRNRLNILFVENRTMTFEQRKILFTDRERLIRFAKRTMPKVDPLLWDQFQDHCYEGEIELIDGVSTALGKQSDYETLTDENENRRQRLDRYLRDRLRAALDRWTDYGEEESEYGEESEQTRARSENEEWIEIEIPDGAFPQPDEAGYEIVGIPIDDDSQLAPTHFQSALYWIPLFDDEEEVVTIDLSGYSLGNSRR